MKFILSIFCLILCASCTSAQTDVPVNSATQTIRPAYSPTSSFISPTRTATSRPTATHTATQDPCDPLAAEFCITDGYFVLQSPILPPDNDSVDRTYPFASTAGGTRDPHRGVEFVNEFGTSVYAAGEGSVIFAGPDDVAIYSPWKIFYGNLVVIQHAGGLFTLYAHLSGIEVEEGEKVIPGEEIGQVGQSGVAIGSHLHFEVRRGDVEDYFSPVNPELWLVPSEPDLGALSISVRDAYATFQRARITLQQFSETGEIVGVNYLDTYHPTLARGDENVGINDLSAGRYRITLIYNGGFYERWVEVQSGKLTQVVIVVK